MRVSPFSIILILCAAGYGLLGLAGCPRAVSLPASLPSHPAPEGGTKTPPRKSGGVQAPALQPEDGIPGTSGWVQAAPGLSYRVGEIQGGLAQMAALRVDPEAYRVVVLDARSEGKTGLTARQFAERHHALAAINGGFFDEKGVPLGLLMHAGKITSPLRHVDWGLFLMQGTQPAVHHTKQGVPAGTTEALQCGPRLVFPRGQPQFKPGESMRSGVGVTEDSQVLLAVTSRGELSLRDFAAALAAWGCREALNLDGGPSSQLYAQRGTMSLDLPGAYPVPDAIAVLPGG